MVYEYAVPREHVYDPRYERSNIRRRYAHYDGHRVRRLVWSGLFAMCRFIHWEGMEFLHLRRTLVILTSDHSLCEFGHEKIDIHVCNCRSVLIEVYIYVQEPPGDDTVEDNGALDDVAQRLLRFVSMMQKLQRRYLVVTYNRYEPTPSLEKISRFSRLALLYLKSLLNLLKSMDVIVTLCPAAGESWFGRPALSLVELPKDDSPAADAA